MAEALAGRIATPVLRLFGGADESITPDALAAAAFAQASAASWQEITAFVAARRP